MATKKKTAKKVAATKKVRKTAPSESVKQVMREPIELDTCEAAPEPTEFERGKRYAIHHGRKEVEGENMLYFQLKDLCKERDRRMDQIAQLKHELAHVEVNIETERERLMQSM